MPSFAQPVPKARRLEWSGAAVRKGSGVRMTTNSLLCGGTAARARAMAALLGPRIVRDAGERPFEGRGLAGDSGRALSLFALARGGDPLYEEAARSQLRRVVLAEDRPGAGLFGGMSGLRGVAGILALEEPRYGKLVEQCDAFIDEQLPPPGDERVAASADFDVISGWSGMRLARCVAGSGERDRLIDLLAWVMADDRRWCCLHPMRLNEAPENDLGLAHGIPGVLAAVALTMGTLDDELRALLARCAHDVRRHARRKGERILWPGHAQAEAGVVVRSAWCYGTPGVAAALYWSARALGDRELGDFALEALEGEARASLEEWGAVDHALCHGTLGNALVFASVGTQSENPVLLEAVERAASAALDGLERDGGACWGMAMDMTRQDLWSELDGAAGIALALLTLVGDADSTWLRLHALEPLAFV